MRTENKKGQIIDTGTIVEAMPNLLYKVELDDGKIVKAYTGGKMKHNKIRMLVGDKVEFVVDLQGNNNRIVKRL